MSIKQYNYNHDLYMSKYSEYLKDKYLNHKLSQNPLYKGLCQKKQIEYFVTIFRGLNHIYRLLCELPFTFLPSYLYTFVTIWPIQLFPLAQWKIPFLLVVVFVVLK